VVVPVAEPVEQRPARTGHGGRRIVGLVRHGRRA
jgi:hypothetical protein